MKSQRSRRDFRKKLWRRCLIWSLLLNRKINLKYRSSWSWIKWHLITLITNPKNCFKNFEKTLRMKTKSKRSPQSCIRNPPKKKNTSWCTQNSSTSWLKKRRGSRRSKQRTLWSKSTYCQVVKKHSKNSKTHPHLIKQTRTLLKNTRLIRRKSWEISFWSHISSYMLKFLNWQPWGKFCLNFTETLKQLKTKIWSRIVMKGCAKCLKL